MEASASEMESYFWVEDGSTACVGIDEACGALFDERPGVGVVDPFIDMEREVVVVLEMRQEHHEKAEAEEHKQEDGCGVFKKSSWYLG
jgi:hypothetical protein